MSNRRVSVSMEPRGRRERDPTRRCRSSVSEHFHESVVGVELDPKRSDRKAAMKRGKMLLRP